MKWKDLNDEMRAHLEMDIQQNLERGMSLEDARRAALRAFGNLTLAQERTRAVWGWMWLETLWQDLRYGWRSLRRTPGFTAAAVLSLALGIGANTAIFSMLDAVLLRSLPVRDPERLAILEEVRGDQRRQMSFPLFRDVESRQEVLEGMVASGSLSLVRASAEGVGDLPAHQLRVRLVSNNYFALLGVEPLLGRTFTPDDEQGVVISFGFWERQFGRDPVVLGRTITLDRTPFTIVAVAPSRFLGDMAGMAADLWVPAGAAGRLNRRILLESYTMSWAHAIGRLKPEMDRRQAEAALTAAYRQALSTELASGRGSRIHRPPRIEECRIELVDGSRGLAGLRRWLERPLRVLMGVVGIVLLIACSNVANLLLARAASRRKEIGIRLAIGAGRARVVRQLLTESALLGLLGGAAGLFLAWLAIGEVASRSVDIVFVGAQGFPLPAAMGLDRRVLGFTLAISLAATLLFGLMPAWQATSANAKASPSNRWRRVLVASQVALSLVLLMGAGLLVRTLQNLRNFDAGLQKDHVLAVELRVDSRTIRREQLPEIVRAAEERLNGLPGVRSAALAEFGLFTRAGTTAPVRVPASRVNPVGDGDVRQSWVTPRFFETLGMRIVRGRGFTAQDAAGSPRVVVLNETMARHYFGDASPLGKLLYFPKLDPQGRYVPFEEAMGPDQAWEIVGVVQDARYDGLRQTTPRMAFLPWFQGTPLLSSVAVRTSVEPASLVAAVRRALREAHPDLIVREIRTLEEQIDRTLGQERLIARLLGFFGLLALVLTGVGLYGVMSFAVARRTHEMGIRLALGAPPSRLLARVLRETCLLAAAGIAVGLLAALGASRAVEAFLFGVKPHDPATAAAAALGLLAVAALAGYLPARRAARVDPVVALRHEP
jgi:predicted permease